MPSTAAYKHTTSADFDWYKTEAGDHRANRLVPGAGWYHLVARKPIGIGSTTWEWDVVYAEVGSEDRLVAAGEAQNWASARAALAAAVDAELAPVSAHVRSVVAGQVALALLDAAKVIAAELERLAAEPSDFRNKVIAELRKEYEDILAKVRSLSTEI